MTKQKKTYQRGDENPAEYENQTAMKKRLSDACFEESYVRHLAYMDGFKGEDWKLALSDTRITGREFPGRNLTGGIFTSSEFIRDVFTSSDLTKAEISYTRWENSDLYGCKAADLSAFFMTAKGCNFFCTDFTGSNFSYADLTGVSVYGCCLRNCDFSYAELSGFDIRSSDFTGAIFTGTCYDYSDHEKLPDFCFYADASGQTVCVTRGLEETIKMPDPFLYTPPGGLNRALGLSEQKVEQMINGYMSGWTADMIDPDTSYIAEYMVCGQTGALIYRSTTRVFLSEEELMEYLKNIFAMQKKKTPGVILSADLKKKTPTDKIYKIYRNQFIKDET